MDKNHDETLKDIATKEDIEYLMRLFYSKALKDTTIGSFFTEIAQINLEDHIPHITNFWEQQLFYTGSYKKNVLQIHKNLYIKKVIEEIHFETWLSLFNTTLDTHFKGTKTNLMKTRALSIATVIKLKLK